MLTSTWLAVTWLDVASQIAKTGYAQAVTCDLRLCAMRFSPLLFSRCCCAVSLHTHTWYEKEVSQTLQCDIDSMHTVSRWEGNHRHNLTQIISRHYSCCPLKVAPLSPRLIGSASKAKLISHSEQQPLCSGWGYRCWWQPTSLGEWEMEK